MAAANSCMQINSYHYGILCVCVCSFNKLFRRHFDGTKVHAKLFIQTQKNFLLKKIVIDEYDP